MIGREKRVLLRHYLEQGMNKAVIARDLGVSPEPVNDNGTCQRQWDTLRD